MTASRIEQLLAFGLAGLTVLSVLVAGLAVPFGPVGTASAAENISSCTWINESGSYQLSSDLNPSADSDLAGDTCIRINSSDVTLDGQGHTVDGSGVSGTYGIQVENTTPGTSSADIDDRLERVTIQNVVLDNWPGSVALRGVNDSDVSTVEVRNTGSGVFYEYGDIANITGITATTGIDGYAVAVSHVQDATISSVTVERAGGDNFAINAKYSPDVAIDHVSIDDRNNPDASTSSAAAAIRIRDSPGSAVTNNTITGIDMQGIRLTRDSAGPGNPNVVVADNVVTEAAGEGLVAFRSDDAVLRDNRLNLTDGVRVEGSTGLAIRDNTLNFDGVSQYGVYLTDTSGTVVAGNTIDGPTTGIYVPDVDPARVDGNHLNDTAWAIDVDGDGSASYAGFPIRDTVVTGGDIRLQDYQNVSITNASVVNGRVQLGANLGDVSNVSLSDVVVTDNHQDAAVYVEGADGVSMENVSAVDGLDGALRVLDASNVTVDGFTVTGQDDSTQTSFIRLVWLTSVDNSTFSGLVVADNRVDGDDGSVNALDVRHTRDTRIENVTVLNNTHGGWPAVRLRGDSSNVTLANARVSPAESGAVEITDTTTDVTASNFTVGAGGPTNATLSFAAHGVVLNSTSSPPINSQATAIGQYFEAINQTLNAYLNVSLHYGSADVSSVNESTLSLWHHDGSSWTELPGATVDTSAQTIDANVTGFSTFGGFGDAVAEPDPANFSMTVDSSNSPVTEGEILTVDTTVENTGDSTGTQTVELSIDGSVTDSTTVTLDSGESQTVSLSWVTADGDAGDYTASVASENDSDTAPVSVTQPQGFAVTIDGTNSPIDEGGTLTVDATVENTGATSGTQTVNLSVDGAVRDSSSVTLASGENTTVTLSWATSDGDAGDYTAAVASDNDSASVAVRIESTSAGSSSGGSSTGGTGGTATSTPTPTATATPIPTASPTATPMPTAGPASTASPSPPATATAEPTRSPTATETPGQPGFGFLVAAAALALFGFGRRWRG